MKRATVRTTHEHAAAVAAALKPDNTAEMETTVDGERVETIIARETTGGLRTSADDYVQNLIVADQTITDTTSNNE
ncbi:MAG: KEOPS complex subunit Pcc1 [Halobacteriales archaeon]|nr:KEOPS complex subunit Pcc1 [Halobacteriales archaeon]